MKYQTVSLQQFFGVQGAIYHVAIATVIFSHAKITCYFQFFYWKMEFLYCLGVGHLYPFLSPTVRFLYVRLKANTNLKKKNHRQKEKPDPNKGSISCKWKFMQNKRNQADFRVGNIYFFYQYFRGHGLPGILLVFLIFGIFRAFFPIT